MSTDLQSIPFRERIAGKWQVPALALSAFWLVAIIVMQRPSPDPLTITDHLANIVALRRGLLLHEAETLARSVIRGGQYEPTQIAPVYAQLAEVLYRIESLKSSHRDRDLVHILATYAQAEKLGHRLDGDALAQQGRVNEWLNRPAAAVEQYEAALQRAPSDPIAHKKQALALRLQAVPTPPAELEQQLDQLLVEATQRPEVLSWALEQQVRLLLDQDRVDPAREIVSTNRSHLLNTDYEPVIEYLAALIQCRSGQFDQAELALRDLRSRLTVRDDIDARSGWLLGRVILEDQGPQRPLEAISFFRDVVEVHSSGEYVTASRLGMAEALTDLQRFEEALSQYRAVLDELKSLSPTRLINRDEVRASLTVRSRFLQQANQPDQAIDYMQLAAQLVDPHDNDARSFYLAELAMMKWSLAERYRGRTASEQQAGRTEAAQTFARRSRELFLTAADDYLELSGRRTINESQSAEALWQAAQMYDNAGARPQTIRLMEGFLVSRPHSDQVPMALFRLGQAYQAEGRLPPAIEQYQRCIREHPRSTAAYESHIPLADCFVMSGAPFAKEAEDTLLYVLEESPDEPGRFTPQAPIYRDALFKLADLYSRDGRVEEAIARFDEALQRYPDDPRLPRALFLLAGAYRRSGLDLEGLASEMGNALRREEMMTRRNERLRKAEELFGQVIAALSPLPTDGMSSVQKLHLQLSHTYRADCAFDLAEYRRALELYQEVVRVYSEEPAALAACLQMINCYESLGRVQEIGPALQRAEWLTDKIAPAEFESSLIRSKPEDWHKLFAWVAATGRGG